MIVARFLWFSFAAIYLFLLSSGMYFVFDYSLDQDREIRMVRSHYLFAVFIIAWLMKLKGKSIVEYDVEKISKDTV